MSRQLVGRRVWSVAGAVCLVAFLGAGMAEARGARPDSGFSGGRGWVALRLPGKVVNANAVAVLPGGRLVIAGQAAPNHPTPTGDVQVFVAEYRADGRLDRGFGHGGVFLTHLPNARGPFDATAVAADRSGRVLVAGGYGQDAMLLMRLTAAGRLDRSFGARRAGYVSRQVGSIASSMALARDGTILLGGSNASVVGRPMVVARFTGRGFRDRRFGRGGLVQLLFWNATLASSSNVGSLVATADGGVVGSGHVDYIGGRPGQGGYGKAGIFRLSASGKLVRSFGERGHVLVGFRNTRGSFKSWFPCAMTVGPRGGITVAGDGSARPEGQILTVRLAPTGRLDRSFGHGGRSVLPGPGDGNLTNCGAVADSRARFTLGIGATVLQLRANGLPNPQFSRQGRLEIPRPPGVVVQAVAAAGRGRLVVAGFARQAAYLARYTLTAISSGLG